jgi:hypothetical protein
MSVCLFRPRIYTNTFICLKLIKGNVYQLLRSKRSENFDFFNCIQAHFSVKYLLVKSRNNANKAWVSSKLWKARSQRKGGIQWKHPTETALSCLTVIKCPDKNYRKWIKWEHESMAIWLMKVSRNKSQFIAFCLNIQFQKSNFEEAIQPVLGKICLTA